MSTDQAGTPERLPVPSPQGRRILVRIGVGLLVVVVGLVVSIASLPDEFRIQRSAQIDVPADIVFPLIDNFHEWGQWSPWESIDPNLKRTFEGSAAGRGAIYSWEGNSEVGSGRMTVIEDKPNELISIKLEFFKPFAAVCPTTFKLEATDGGTKVTWTMDGKNNFIGKTMSLFMNMDKMVGKSFEDGLAKLNQVAQANAKKANVPPPSAEEPQSLIEQTKLSIKDLGECFKLYAIDHDGDFPPSDKGLEVLLQQPKGDANWHGPYALKIPLDAWGKPFHYAYPNQHDPYGNRPDISSGGPDKAFGTPDDISNRKN